MKKKKEKWYLWSKLTKGQLANEYNKLDAKFAKNQIDLDFANEQVNVLNSKLRECLKDIEELKNKVKEEEGYALRSKVHLLEKLVALHEKTPSLTTTVGV